MRFSRPESEQARQRRVQSYEFLQKKHAEEPWVHLHHHGLRVSARPAPGAFGRPGLWPRACTPDWGCWAGSGAGVWVRVFYALWALNSGDAPLGVLWGASRLSRARGSRVPAKRGFHCSVFTCVWVVAPQSLELSSEDSRCTLAPQTPRAGAPQHFSGGGAASGFSGTFLEEIRVDRACGSRSDLLPEAPTASAPIRDGGSSSSRTRP